MALQMVNTELIKSLNKYKDVISDYEGYDSIPDARRTFLQVSCFPPRPAFFSGLIAQSMAAFY